MISHNLGNHFCRPLHIKYLPISEAKYAYNGEAAGEDSPALRHLREVSKSNLNVARKNPVTTTDYGFIDMPPLPPSSQNTHGRGSEHESKGGLGNNLGDKSRITADEDMIAGKEGSPLDPFDLYRE